MDPILIDNNEYPRIFILASIRLGSDERLVKILHIGSL